LTLKRRRYEPSVHASQNVKRKPTWAVRFDPDVAWPYCGLVSTVAIVQFGELNALNTSAMASSEM